MILDTHIFYDFVLGVKGPFMGEYEAARVAVSAVSAGELGCLQRLGRVTLSLPADQWFEAAVLGCGAQVLPVTAATFARAMLLDWDHRDPADRLLWQTLLEHPGSELHTRDRRILDRAAVTGAAVRDCRV